ncbi:MAG TPA: GNAT family N-acetyltransferase [Polyangiaceae bacterium]|jgi:predicted acetyltransferase|nr:GNAT family N-acetyltransferase [Polyangiaceae bacterium]
MNASPDVSLTVAAESDSALLANLLELYIHDLSEVFPAISLGADGRFGYRRLPLYWSEPERRFAFLIRNGEKVSGFILVTRGYSPASVDRDVLDIAEFFVLRAHRRAGVGRLAAHALWDRLPGRWTVRVSEGNFGALAFWPKVVEQYSGGHAVESQLPGEHNAWRVFSFASSGLAP